MPRLGSTSKLPKNRSGCSSMRRSPVLAAEADADHRPLDVVVVHLVEDDLERVGLLLDVLRDVLEHVLDRELEVLLALPVHEAAAKELVPVLLVALGDAEHEVDHAHVGGEAHPARLEHVSVLSLALAP